jgi:hypothetical protein
VDVQTGHQEYTCLQKLGRDGEASHDVEANRDVGEESGRRGRCRREEAIVAEASVDGMCWRICRPCLIC